VNPTLTGTRLAVVTVTLLLLWRIIQVNVVLYDETGRPRLAAAPAAASEVVSREARALEQSALRGILKDNPGEVAALLMLAREFEVDGDVDRAARAYRSALELAPLDREVLLLSAAHFLRRDNSGGIELLALLAAHYPATRSRVFPVLAEIVASGRHRTEVAGILSRDPAWLSSFLIDACSRGIDPLVLVPTLLRRAASGRADPAEAACAIDRLRAAGRWEQAYQLWLNLLPRERLANVGFVFNGSFEYEPSGIGFDWIPERRPEKETGHVAGIVPARDAAGKLALRVVYNGKRQAGYPVRQFLMLGPGQYELSGMARLDGIKAIRGIHWTVRCVEEAGPAGILAASERFVGSGEWRQFAMNLKIERGCRGQVLQLEPVADDGAVAFVSGTAWFDDLKMRRR
jgi:hypothetical protein